MPPVKTKIITPINKKIKIKRLDLNSFKLNLGRVSYFMVLTINKESRIISGIIKEEYGCSNPLILSKYISINEATVIAEEGMGKPLKYDLSKPTNCTLNLASLKPPAINKK